MPIKSLEELEAEEKSLGERIQESIAAFRALEAQRGIIRTEIARQKFGVYPGSIVRYHEKLHRVTRVDLWKHGRPWVYGNPMKLDGSYGKAERALYTNWEPVSPEIKS